MLEKTFPIKPSAPIGQSSVNFRSQSTNYPSTLTTNQNYSIKKFKITAGNLKIFREFASIKLAKKNKMSSQCISYNTAFMYLNKHERKKVRTKDVVAILSENGIVVENSGVLQILRKRLERRTCNPEMTYDGNIVFA